MTNQLPGIEDVKKYLVETFKLDGLPEDRLREIADKLSLALAERVFLATFERLGDEDAKKLDDLVSSEASEEEIRNFLETKIPEYTSFTRGIADDFIKELRAGIPADDAE